MTKTYASRQPQAAKKDIYTRVTETIVDMLEKGVRPWQKPWTPGKSSDIPLRSTGEAYRGINVLMLWISSCEKGYTNPHWITYKQAESLGGHVKKGEKATPVVYWNTTEKETEDAATGETRTDKRWLLREYSVFNVEQCSDLPDKFTVIDVDETTTRQRVAHAKQFFDNTNADIRTGGSKAYFSPSTDHIQMPPLKAFRDAESYESTLAHEMVHWTMTPSRCMREFGSKGFGSPGYATEELVAEIGAAFLCAELKITPTVREDHASYIANWLAALKNDKRLIMTAASHAAKACDFLRGLQPQA